MSYRPRLIDGGSLLPPTTIAGGFVVNADGRREADVVIEGGKVAAVGRGVRRGEVVDASGCYVLPGGVDAHTHLMDDFASATRGALLGGTTTVFSFTNPAAGEGDLECFRRRVSELGAGGAYADVALHAMLYQPERTSPEELAAFRREGAAACKVFLAYGELGIMCSTGRLLELMSSAAGLGLLVQVHCENGELIEVLVRRAVAEARRGAGAFAATRPAEVEEEAVARTIAVASLAGASCYLVHLSSRGAIDQVRLSRKGGHPPVFAEVCVHHLLFDDDRYGRDDAGRYLVAPPLRSAWHLDALWRAVADGTVDVVASDHSQTPTALPAELRAPGETPRYGLAGVGARLPVLLSEGLRRGLSLERIVGLASYAPARIFGLAPRKGVLAVGSDADVVVWDPSATTRVAKTSFDDGTGGTVYEGLVLDGSLRHVWLGGRLVVTGTALTGLEPGGRFVSTLEPGPVC